MPIDKETQSMKSIVVTKELEKVIQALADENKRSFSAQVLYMCEQYLKDKGFIIE
jgi:hypothetical protein